MNNDQNIVKMELVGYPKFNGSGLGNMIWIWAKCFIWCKDNKFEMIVAHAYAWDIMLDEEYLNSLVNNLASGGILVIAGTNESSSIYSSSYRWHPYYDAHEALKNLPGVSYHFAQFLGTSVFVKN